MNPAYVFVHGSTSNSKSWSAMQREMALRGHRSLAVDLPGRASGFSVAYHTQDLGTFTTEPSPLADITAADTMGHVVDIVRQARAHGPVILVGHSLGGLAISGAGNEIPDLIDRLVYIAALCPVRPAAEYVSEYLKGSFLPAVAPLHVGHPAKQGFVRVNWRGATPEQVEALRLAVNQEASPRSWIGALTANQPDETLGQWDPGYGTVDKDTWGRIPRTFIRTHNDKACPLTVQDMYIEEGDALTPDNPWDVRSAESSHAGFLTLPGEVADILAGFAT